MIFFTLKRYLASDVAMLYVSKSILIMTLTMPKQAVSTVEKLGNF